MKHHSWVRKGGSIQPLLEAPLSVEQVPFSESGHHILTHSTGSLDLISLFHTHEDTDACWEPRQIPKVQSEFSLRKLVPDPEESLGNGLSSDSQERFPGDD